MGLVWNSGGLLPPKYLDSKAKKQASGVSRRDQILEIPPTRNPWTESWCASWRRHSPSEFSRGIRWPRFSAPLNPTLSKTAPVRNAPPIDGSFFCDAGTFANGLLRLLRRRRRRSKKRRREFDFRQRILATRASASRSRCLGCSYREVQQSQAFRLRHELVFIP